VVVLVVEVVVEVEEVMMEVMEAKMMVEVGAASGSGIELRNRRRKGKWPRNPNRGEVHRHPA
jgi:hypothetical protein